MGIQFFFFKNATSNSEQAAGSSIAQTMHSYICIMHLIKTVALLFLKTSDDVVNFYNDFDFWTITRFHIVNGKGELESISIPKFI